MPNAMTDIPGIGNIMKFIGELIPGEQDWLGEIPGGGTGLIGAPLAALAALIPGTQGFLGEQKSPPKPYVRAWSTGTVTMFLLQDGKIGCYKKNGLWKEWRPARHIVVPRNPRIGTLIQAHKRTTRLMNGMAKQAGYTKRKPMGRLNQYFTSPAERKLLGAGN